MSYRSGQHQGWHLPADVLLQLVVIVAAVNGYHRSRTCDLR
jgi:hypothetical protein